VNSKTLDIKSFLSKYVLECILFVILIFLTFSQPGFLTVPNLLNILRNMSMMGIIAFGMTIVIISAEIDLSVGSTVGLSGVIVAFTTGALVKQGIPMEYGVLIGIAIALAAGIIIGLFNGYLLTVIKMPSFIITLGMYTLLYGVAAVICKGFPITSLPEWYNNIGAGQIFGIVPIPAIILLVVFAIIFVLMNYTKFGRSVYAVGGNPEAARLSGINVSFVKTAGLVIVQVLAVLAGILVSSQVMSGNYTFGNSWGMTVISACIIGGTSIFGGIGKVWGTLVGLIFLGVIMNGMTLLGVDEFVQYIVRGGLILFAVFISTLQTNTKS
jgi:ribose/xylose/arabinose/galactoside ABC-type transport system permease subunit